jgi:hypothetical protein
MEAQLAALEKDKPDDDFLPILKEELLMLKESTGLSQAAEMPTDKPRLIKSHLPFCLLNPDVLTKNKVVNTRIQPSAIV